MNFHSSTSVALRHQSGHRSRRVTGSKGRSTLQFGTLTY